MSEYCSDVSVDDHSMDHEAAERHKTVYRPWGRYSVLEDADDCKVRRLVVKPGQVLALQLHRKRSEQWTVLSGEAKARIDDREFSLRTGDSVTIPPETRHRLENPGVEDLHVIFRTPRGPVEAVRGSYRRTGVAVAVRAITGTPGMRSRR